MIVPLPPALRPWWPLFKRLHRALTRVSGAVYRVLGLVLPGGGVPRTATDSSLETARLEPKQVSVHPASPAVDVPRVPVSGAPAHHWVFEQETVAHVPAGFVLDIKDGRLVGDFAAAITPGNRLDHETSRYFGTTDWREHPVFLRPTLGQVERVAGTALSLTNRGTSGNYYHFMYDAVARFGLFEEAMSGARLDAIIVPHRSGYQKQLLELAGITGPFLQPERGKVYQADRLLVPSNPNWALDAPPAMVEWLRRRLVPRNPPEDPVRLILSRGNVRLTRRYVEEQALVAALEPHGFRLLDPGTLSVQEQIDVFSRAEMIVAPHGAGLTNVTFSPAGVRVLELFPSTYVHRGLWAICQAIGADYRYLVADGPGGPEGPNAGIADDVSIAPERIVAQVEEMLQLS